LLREDVSGNAGSTWRPLTIYKISRTIQPGRRDVQVAASCPNLSTARDLLELGVHTVDVLQTYAVESKATSRVI
jgi:hypothetical protein